jgi:UDP-glucose 4-epimerase
VNQQACNGVEAYNLGTGTGYSVLELVSAFEQASGGEGQK